MEQAHAVLSPSSAERWISCPASVRMAATVTRDDIASGYAMEGTAAHAFMEIKASYVFSLITQHEHDLALREWEDVHGPFISGREELQEHTTAYLDLIDARLDATPNSQLRLEQRMPSGIDRCWGTSDAVIVSPTVVEIIDLKYGQGIPVDAKGNPQLRLYGLGALDTFGDVLGNTETVRMWVFQPRLNSTSCEEMTADALRAWREEIRPIAEEALGDRARFGPSEKACRWCPVSGQCRAQLEWATGRDFGRDPDLLEPEELSAALAAAPGIKAWLAALEVAALDLAYSQATPIPGWKVVLSGGQRAIKDQEAALDALHQAGYDDDVVTQKKILGIGALEKLLGKDGFANILGDLAPKSPGKPAIVPEDDKRPAISPDSEAAKEFGDV